MRVLTFNIRYDNAGDRPNHWPARRPLLAEVLQSYAAHVMAFQEVLPHQRQDLEAMLPDCDWHGRGREPAGDGEGCYLFWRREFFTQVEGETLWLGPDPTLSGRAWDAACPRIYNQVTLETLEGQQFQVFNLHLDHIGVVARQKSAELVHRRMQERSLPTVVLGDLNVENALESLPALQGLQDCSSIHGADQEGTFHGFGGLPTLGPIDYVLATEHFGVDFCQRILDHQGLLYPSDHFGVMAQLAWR